MAVLRGRGPTFTLILFLIGVGCSQPAPTIPTAKKVVPELPPEETAIPSKPASSDEKALVILRDCLNAHTGNAPEKLNSFRSASMIRRGVLETGVPGGFPADWSVDLVWPKQYRFRSKLEQAGTSQTVSFGTDPKPWRFPAVATPTQPVPDLRVKQELDEAAIGDLRSQMNEDAFSLLFPLRDPATIVQLGQDTTIGTSAALGLQVWTPALDYARIWIDKETKLLVRFAYRGQEQGRPVDKTLTLGKFEDFAGVKLPTEAEVNVRSRTLARWTKLIVEANKKFDPKIFDAP
jgi:hypothetical protein